MVPPAASSDAAAKLVAIGGDRQFLDFLAEALSGSPAEVTSVADPQEGLKLALDEAADIVLLDVSMLPALMGSFL